MSLSNAGNTQATARTLPDGDLFLPVTRARLRRAARCLVERGNYRIVVTEEGSAYPVPVVVSAAALSVGADTGMETVYDYEDDL